MTTSRRDRDSTFMSNWDQPFLKPWDSDGDDSIIRHRLVPWEAQQQYAGGVSDLSHTEVPEHPPRGCILVSFPITDKEIILGFVEVLSKSRRPGRRAPRVWIERGN